MNENKPRRVLIISDEASADSELRKLFDDYATQTATKSGTTFVVNMADDYKSGLKMVEAAATEISYTIVFFDLHDEISEGCIKAVAKIAELDPNIQIVIAALPGKVGKEIFEKFGNTERLYLIKKPFAHKEIFQLSAILVKKWELNQDANSAWSLRTVAETEKLEKPENFAERAVNACADGVMIFGASRPLYPIVYVNAAFERLTGYTSEEVMGRSFLFLQGADRDQPDMGNIHLALEKQIPAYAELRNYRKSGSMYWSALHVAPMKDDAGTVTHYVAMFYDITNHKNVADKLAYQATHDTLTDLPNRALLMDRIQQSIVFAKRYGMILGVLFFDLDDFKTINDSLGHPAGDALLQSVAGKLGECVRESDTVARLGGDEFVVVLTSLLKEDDYLPIVQRILSTFSEPIYFEGRKFTFTSSMGISFYPKNGQDAQTLLKNADTALYRAKELGKNNFQLYRAGMKPLTKESQTSLKNDLRRALTENEFLLHYQPIVDMATRKITGFEALLRWQHPSHGLIPPNMFIPLAEESGLMIPIGEWVLKTACAQNKAWQSSGLRPVLIAVNFSNDQFKQRDTLGTIVKILKDTKLSPQYLELEIKEATIKEDVKNVISTMLKLQGMNASLVLDDFGMGHSKAEDLMQFPIHKIKIDQSFIRGALSNEADMKTVKGIIKMARSLKMRILAVGVETKEQLTFLETLTVDEVQGFYFSRPITAQGCTQLLLEDAALPVEGVVTVRSGEQ